MSQHNEKNPHQHQSPLHDSSEAKPGMDSLAPEDGSHRPAKNLILWKTYAKAVKIMR